MEQTLGARIRAVRKQRGMRLKELIERTESSPATIWRLENGDTHNPHVQLIVDIAKTLEVSTDYLLGLSDE